MKKLFYLSLMAVAFSACSNEQIDDSSDTPNKEEGSVITFVATKNSENFNNVKFADTRVSKDEFQSGDKMLVFIEKNSSSEHYAKSEFTVGSDGKLTSNPEITYPAEENIDVYSFYPSDLVTGENLSGITFAEKYKSIAADQKQGSNSSTDVLYASVKNKANSVEPIQLVYNHVFAKISIKIIKEEGAPNVSAINIVGTKRGIDYSFTEAGGLVANAMGTESPIAVDVKEDAYAEALVCPQNLAEGANLIQFVTDSGEKYYSVKTGGLELKAGWNYNFAVTVTADGEVEEKLSITLQGEDSTPILNCSVPSEATNVQLQVSSSEDFTDYKVVPDVNQTTQYEISASDLGTGYVGMMYYRLVMDGQEPTDFVSLHSHFDVSSGDGTKENGAYVISNVRHLKNIGAITETGKIFHLANDINLTGVDFTPLCPEGFNNTFSGQNFVISGLTINNSNSDYVGLFAKINVKGEVNQVKLDNTSITAKSYIGGIAGICHGKISECTVSGNITGMSHIGGIVGYMEEHNGTPKPCIMNSINNANITSNITSGEAYVGGIIGYLYINSYAVKKCGNNGAIKAQNGTHVGGIIGCSSTLKSVIELCYNKNTITGAGYVGGILGKSDDIEVSNSYNTGDVNSTSKGLVALNCSGIIGGIGSKEIGLLCYNIGLINDGKGTGIFYTENEEHKNTGKNMSRCHCLDTSAASAFTENSYYGATENVMKTAEDMKKQETYTAANRPDKIYWDFDNTWIMPEGGYPKLRWEN